MRLISNHLRRSRTLSTYATGGQPHTPTARLIAEVSQAPSSENYGTPTHTITSSSESPKVSHLVLSLSRNDTRRWRTKVCFIRALTYIPWGLPWRLHRKNSPRLQQLAHNPDRMDRDDFIRNPPPHSIQGLSGSIKGNKVLVQCRHSFHRVHALEKPLYRTSTHIAKILGHTCHMNTTPHHDADPEYRVCSCVANGAPCAWFEPTPLSRSTNQRHM